MSKRFVRSGLLWAALSGAAALAGCIGATDIFNESFINTVTGSEQVASLPQNAPFILLTIENRTNNLAEVEVTYRTTGAVVERLPATVEAGAKFAQAVPCPIDEITVGEITDLTVSGAVVRLGDGGADSPFVAVEPYGRLLTEGINYSCGDGVTFAVVSSTETASGYRVLAFVQSR